MRPSGAIEFSFNYGFALANSVVFHADPGPPPYNEYLYYTASNAESGLRINGTVGTSQSVCADVPTRFSHSNVVAVLVSPPRLTLLGFSSGGGARLFLQGNAGQTNVIEASVDLTGWTPISTNVLDYTVCPICPFVIFDDTLSSNLTRRFYRGFELH